jgi:stress response protein SCP2
MNLVTPETIAEYFGSGNHAAIVFVSRRRRGTEWLRAMVTTRVSGEIIQMSKRAQALQIQAGE